MKPVQLTIIQALFVLPVLIVTLVLSQFIVLLNYAIIGVTSLVILGMSRNGLISRDTLFVLPNLLTLSRVAVLFILLYFKSDLPKLFVSIILILIVVADAVDGYLARRLNQTTDLGEVLDIEADSLFTLLLVILYVLEMKLFSWMIIIAILRYVYIIILELLSLSTRDHKKQKLSSFVSVSFSIGLALYWYFQNNFIRSGLVVLGIGIIFTFVRDFLYRLGYDIL